MELLLAILLFAVGLIVIIIGGELLVNASIKFSKVVRISEFVVGATLVSIATTLPEILVSSIAAFKGEFSIAIDSSIGTVITNTALILGLGFAFFSGDAKGKSLQIKFFYLIASILLFAGFILNKQIEIWESVILLLLFVGFMILNIIDTKKQEKDQIKQIKEEIEKIQNKNTEKQKRKNRDIWFIVFGFLIGAGAIFGGAELMVTYASKIAEIAGMSKELIGLTIVALGTSLPELVTAITAIRKKHSSLSIGNIVGANVINITLLMGLCGIISLGKITTSNATLYINVPIFMAVTLLAGLPILIKQKTYKWQGWTLIASYVAYLTYCIVYNVI